MGKLIRAVLRGGDSGNTVSLTRHFLTTSDGKHYGTFHGKLRERQKRRRKAKLRVPGEERGQEASLHQ